MSVRGRQVLRQIVVKCTEARKILRGKVAFLFKGVTAEKLVAVMQIAVHADGPLVGIISVRAQIEIIVGIRAGWHGGRAASHGHHPMPPIFIMPPIMLGSGTWLSTCCETLLISCAGIMSPGTAGAEIEGLKGWQD